jgi:hypothetical protein
VAGDGEPEAAAAPEVDACPSIADKELIPISVFSGTSDFSSPPQCLPVLKSSIKMLVSFGEFVISACN